MSVVYTRFQFLRYLIQQKIYWLKAYCLNSRSSSALSLECCIADSISTQICRASMTAERTVPASTCSSVYRTVVYLHQQQYMPHAARAIAAGDVGMQLRIRHAHRLRSHSSLIMYISPARHRYLKCCTRYAAKQLVSKRHSISNGGLQCVLGGNYQSR